MQALGTVLGLVRALGSSQPRPLQAPCPLFSPAILTLFAETRKTNTAGTKLACDKLVQSTWGTLGEELLSRETGGKYVHARRWQEKEDWRNKNKAKTYSLQHICFLLPIVFCLFFDAPSSRITSCNAILAGNTKSLCFFGRMEKAAPGN